MAMKLNSTIVFFLVMFISLSLLPQNHAKDMDVEAPSPQPHPNSTFPNIHGITQANSPQPHPNSTFPNIHGITQGSLTPQECGPRCTARCSKTQYKKPCLFFCQKCCAKCLCVPPGTYGNKQVCPCYNNWKTKRGGPKCP